MKLKILGNSFDIIIYNYGTSRINISIDEVNYDQLMEELTDERLSKLNIEDPDKTLIITTKLIRGDKIDYYDFYNYLKNNYKIVWKKIINYNMRWIYIMLIKVYF